MNPKHSSFFDRMHYLALEMPERIALIDRGNCITVEALHDESLRLAAGLSSSGVKRGDRVAVWLPNCISWVETFLACAYLGATVIAVNTRFKSHELSDVLSRGKATWLFMWPDFKSIPFLSMFNDMEASAIAGLQGIICINDQRSDSNYVDVPGDLAVNGSCPVAIRDVNCHDYHGLKEASRGVAPPSASGNEAVLTFSTSGTTSLPKFVLHDQQTLIAHGDALMAYFGYGSNTKILASAPFCGAFGFATLIGGLVSGVPVVCAPVFTPEIAMGLIKKHAITHTYADQQTLQKIMQCADSPWDLRSIKLFGFSSFTPAIKLFIDMAAACKVPVTALYGSSELIALVAAQPTTEDAGDTSVRYVAGGKLTHPTARVRVCDPGTKRVLPHGESGEIEIKSPSIMVGYLDDGAAPEKAITSDGYFKTGDLGYTLSDTQFVFQNRMGDALRISGFLVNPLEIEKVVESIAGIQACQIVGITTQGQQILYAFVVLEKNVKTDVDLWKAICKNNMASFKVPAYFEVLDDFPKIESANATKIQKHKLRSMAEAKLAIIHYPLARAL